MNIKDLDDSNFESTIKAATKPVLVDFHAPWCGPCKAMAPAVHALADERTDVQVVKVNLDEAFETAKSLGIRGVPTVMLFQDGVAVKTKTGSMTKTQLEEFLS